MFEWAKMLESIENDVAELARGVDPTTVPASAAMGLVSRLGRVERQVAGVKLLLAGRVAETSVWKHQGHRSPAHWLAGQSGTSVAEAVSTLETAERLRELPVTAAAVRDGRLSRAQAAAVSDAVVLAPEAEADLLAVADRESLKGLQAEAARRKVAHLDEAERHARIHASRQVRFGTDHDGAATMSVRTTTDAMAEIRAAVAHFQQQAFERARSDGRREAAEAYAADGLLAMARASLQGPESHGGKRLPTKVVVRVDHTALARGSVRAGEICEVGGGPVPVSVARQLIETGEAFTAAVVTGADGQVRQVGHLGRRAVPVGQLLEVAGPKLREVSDPRTSRRPDVYQTTALDWTTPTCTVAGCDHPRQQIDHRVDWADVHVTTLGDLDGYCAFHHAEKTKGYLRIEGTLGRRSMVPTTPPEPEPPDP